MKLTNRHNLPEPFLDFIRNDKYSRGSADISVTQLIDSPRVRFLNSIGADEIEMDAVDRVWSLFGTAVHHILETSNQTDGVIKEERLSMVIKGWVLSGAVDYQHHYVQGGAKVDVIDYKVTSAWSVILGKEDWERQLNCYAHLIENQCPSKVNKLQICAILRDWQRKKAETDPSYPQAPVTMVDVPLWDYETRVQYLNERMTLHQEAQQAWDTQQELPPCSSEEMWEKPDTFAVKKKKQKRALRVLNSYEKAEHYISDQPNPSGLSIETRQGARTRCEGNYCNVADICQRMGVQNG